MALARSSWSAGGGVVNDSSSSVVIGGQSESAKGRKE